MSTVNSIYTAFNKRLALMPSNLANTAQENVNFTPPSNSTPYQAVFLLVGDPLNPTLGDLYYREIGLFRIRLLYPTNVGTGAARSQAEKIKDWFYRGLTLQEDGYDVIIQNTPSVSAGSIIGDRYALTVDIKYFVSVLKT